MWWRDEVPGVARDEAVGFPPRPRWRSFRCSSSPSRPPGCHCPPGSSPREAK